MKRRSGVNGVASTSLAPVSASRPPPPERILSATSEGEPFSAEEDDERIADLARLRPKSPRTFGLFTSPRAKLNPFELEHDPTTAWAYRPSVLTCLGGLAGCVMLFAYHTENLVIPTRVKKQSGLITAVIGFLLVSIINFRDGPYKRPHPAFWRAVLGSNVLYCMTLAYLLWQDDVHGREFIQWFDPSLNHPADEKSYGQNCAFTATNLYNGLDHFALAHFLGWFGKAVILRDFWACTILSVMFEITEMSLSHQIENFNECWWDRWILDISVCNLGGTLLGLLTCHYLDVTPFSWRGDRTRRFGRMFEPITPHEWTKFDWRGTKRFRNYLSVITLLTTFLLSELNVFYLKTLLWLPAEHPTVFAWALPATAEFYHYVTYSKRVKRMGSHAVMLLTTVCLESLIVLKWSTGKFPTPAPLSVKIFWTLFLSALVAYPLLHFGGRKGGRNQSGKNTPATTENGQRPISSGTDSKRQ